jgi:hypothetical protein
VLIPARNPLATTPAARVVNTVAAGNGVRAVVLASGTASESLPAGAATTRSVAFTFTAPLLTVSSEPLLLVFTAFLANSAPGGVLDVATATTGPQTTFAVVLVPPPSPAALLAANLVLNGIVYRCHKQRMSIVLNYLPADDANLVITLENYWDNRGILFDMALVGNKFFYIGPDGGGGALYRMDILGVPMPYTPSVPVPAPVPENRVQQVSRGVGVHDHSVRPRANVQSVVVYGPSSYIR